MGRGDVGNGGWRCDVPRFCIRDLSAGKSSYRGFLLTSTPRRRRAMTSKRSASPPCNRHLHINLMQVGWRDSTGDAIRFTMDRTVLQPSAKCSSGSAPFRFADAPEQNVKARTWTRAIMEESDRAGFRSCRVHSTAATGSYFVSCAFRPGELFALGGVVSPRAASKLK